MPQNLVQTIAFDPYNALGVTPDADLDTIRRAFRKLAFELHPDRNGAADTTERFVQVRQAYELLSDPTLKREQETAVIVAQMTRAADEARKSRKANLDRTEFSSFVIPPGRPLLRVFRLEEARALKATMTTVLLAAGLIVLTGVLAFTPLAFASAAVLLLGVGIWLFRGKPFVLRIYGHGFMDSRWESAGRIGWADIRWLDPDPIAETVTLLLDPVAGRELAEIEDSPRGILIKKNNEFHYRIDLGSAYKKGMELFTGRTGLIDPTK